MRKTLALQMCVLAAIIQPLQAAETDLAGLPQREGPKPKTSEAPPRTRTAHQQLSDLAPVEWQDWIFEQASKLPGVVTGPSHVSVKGARAFHLAGEIEGVNPDGFMVRREFAHLHPPYDGSLHLILPEPAAQTVIDRGWGERHPRSPRSLMIFGPRNEKEAHIVLIIVTASYQHALGGAEALGEAPISKP